MSLFQEKKIYFNNTAFLKASLEYFVAISAVERIMGLCASNPYLCWSVFLGSLCWYISIYVAWPSNTTRRDLTVKVKQLGWWLQKSNASAWIFSIFSLLGPLLSVALHRIWCSGFHWHLASPSAPIVDTVLPTFIVCDRGDKLRCLYKRQDPPPTQPA